MNTSTRPRPLDGMTVISLEHAIAAPLCTRHLADQGARVIKIERPKVGDFARAYDQRVRGLASHFVWTNRSKESLTLDLKSEAGKQVLRELLQKADIFVQNLAPGAAARMGLSFNDLHPAHPRLIVCDISGYGKGGPLEHKKAYDLLIQSEGGFLSVTGGSEPDQMAKAGISIADISAGIYAYNGILSALLLREKTGLGSAVEISMLETMVEWMGFPLYYAFDGAPPPPRAGAAHATIYPYGPFAVGSEGSVMLGLQNEREWLIFCQQVLEQEELATDPRFNSNVARVTHRDSLRDIIVATFTQLGKQEVINRLDKAGIANANVNEMKDLWAHPQLKARDRWTHIESGKGTLPALLPPANNNCYEPRMDGVPDLGQHTIKILTELGYTDEDIVLMKAESAI